MSSSDDRDAGHMKELRANDEYGWIDRYAADLHVVLIGVRALRRLSPLFG